jgi:hypothetical protein
MSVHSSIGRAIASGALFLGVATAPLLFAGGSAAQNAPAAAPANMSAHDAAVDAARRRDYVAALDFAKKAAAAGQPIDAEQLDFITSKAAKQQADLDAAAKLKASQEAAATTAQQIQARQQDEYAKLAKKGGAPVTNNCRQAEGGQVQTATDVYASGINRGGTIGPVTSEGGRKGSCS